MKEIFSFLIVGAGLTGSVFARELAEKGHRVLIIDKREHIGGNCYDYSLRGITVHKYGPHIFHTNNGQVWRYLSKFTKWYPYIHKVLALINGTLVPIPFNFNSICTLFPHEMAKRFENKLTSSFKFDSQIPVSELIKSDDSEIKLLADFIYEKVFAGYTEKQWGISADKINPLVLSRVPISISRDDRYFTDKYQGIPENGYTKMIENILQHQNITIKTSTDFSNVKANLSYDKLIYTGSIDEYFDYEFGPLPYRSLRFILNTYEFPEYQPSANVNYPCNYDFTRITEFKHFQKELFNHTTVAEEYPEEYKRSYNEPFYPVSNPESQALYDKYTNLCNKVKNVHFAGRLGWYKYYNMDTALERTFDEIKPLL
jgi:UDP-galactopyranose mutase